MTDSLFWLVLTAVATLFMAFPYVLERISRVGLAALGYSADRTSGGFEQRDETPAAWAERAYRAHRNAIESLPIFAALVLTAHITNLGGDLVALAASTYFFARLAHYVLYTAGIPVVRTLAFFVAWGSLFVIGYALLNAA
jgi:uncharacterized MAPEG superfamily protein